MKVKATQRGYYGDKIREPGEEFELRDPAHLSRHWMKPDGAEAEKAAKASAEAEAKAKAEAEKAAKASAEAEAKAKAEAEKAAKASAK